jgi:RNA polymerase sigma-70 factor (ECF subfamily)
MSVVVDNKSKVKFESLIKDVQLRLYSYIFSLVPHKQDAEDVLQKTNLILFEKQHLYDSSKGSFHCWAYSIARYQVMGHKTRHARSKICFSNELTEVLADEFSHDNLLSLRKKALNNCYSKLPKHMQAIAHLRFKRELPIKDIAKELNRPIGSISATLSRIRGALAKCIHVEFLKLEQQKDQ